MTINEDLVKLVGGEHQRRLFKHLLEDKQYDPLERPVANDTQSVRVAMSLAIQQIIDFVSCYTGIIMYLLHVCMFFTKKDEKNEIISLSGWLVFVSILR